MNSTRTFSPAPFLVVAGMVAAVGVAIVQLPDSFITQIRRNSPLSSAQAGWLYRLLLLAALAQAAYGAFVILRPERVGRARREDKRIATMSHARLLMMVARGAAGMTVLTLIYGLAFFVATGLRGGFWLFPLICVAQLAWYYRQAGQIDDWLRFQPEPPTGMVRRPWVREPPDYCPPIARALSPIEKATEQVRH